ncbi:DUF5367 domain-containing protein [Brevibacillus ruminantium]|uniref:DUF5367 domain-containing protein n=1 Tax=Brevibacillus ruminantium TaxID=2950604 RepID=A0ABY4WBU5_9BACL|nr:DUF5367 family protein [Brevibacillus ruminantium]USG63392.1 DUF5367 domain-containing protein [Brevibacillus ruminantium]
MKKYLLPSIWGLFVWILATLFFILFGNKVLYPPGTHEFTISLILLVACTGVVLWLVTTAYLIFDKTDHASLKFGIIGTIIGLTLDTFSISYHSFIFPALDESQVISFTAWMAIAYALYLVIPIMMDQNRRKKNYRLNVTNKC